MQFISRSPTASELQSIPIEQRIELTSKLEWEPTMVCLSSTTTSEYVQHFVEMDEHGDYTYLNPDTDELYCIRYSHTSLLYVKVLFRLLV